MRLNKAQKQAVIEWVAEGLETDEINKRAAKFKPRFKVSKQQVGFYRSSRGNSLKEIQQADEYQALKQGLALRLERVKALNGLADAMLVDLLPTDKRDGKLWLTNKKAVGMSVHEYQEFNKAEVDALRGVLDDLAKEVGERRPDIEVNNTYNFNMEEWKKARAQRLKDIAALEE
jgi:hypothetical protein